MRTLMTFAMLAATGALAAESETFHGWSKDGSWLVYEQRTHDDRTELFFCVTDGAVTPTWPKALDEMDREDGTLSCVRFLDPNKAPYQWKNQLVLPPPSMAYQGIVIASELVTDGESPGFVLTAGDKKQSCYASGTRDDSKLQKAWFHPSAKYVAALIDGSFRHCAVTLKPTKPGKGGKKR